MELWIQYRWGYLRGGLVGTSMLLILAACTLAPPADEPAGVSPAQRAGAIPPSGSYARVITRYQPLEDVTVVEYRAATPDGLTFLAYYTVPGRVPSGAPDTLHFGCVVHHDAGNRGQGAGARLIFRAQDQPLDLGELRFAPGAGADNYWREGVPRQTVLPVLAAATLEGSCGGVPFRLSPAQWATLQAFVAGAAAESGR
jgi:hypothetical protein